MLTITIKKEDTMTKTNTICKLTISCILSCAVSLCAHASPVKTKLSGFYIGSNAGLSFGFKNRSIPTAQLTTGYQFKNNIGIQLKTMVFNSASTSNSIAIIPEVSWRFHNTSIWSGTLDAGPLLAKQYQKIECYPYLGLTIGHPITKHLSIDTGLHALVGFPQIMAGFNYTF